MKHNYNRLKLRLFFTTILAALAGVLLCGGLLYIAVDGFLQEPFANAAVRLAQRILHINEAEAISVYHRLFQNYKSVWVSVGFLVMLLICFYFSLSALTRRLGQIETGIDSLAEEGQEEIQLPPELEEIERKLNQVRSTLQKSARDAKEAEQRKNDLVMYLAHDMKTPLTSVIAYLSLLEDTADLPREVRAKYVGIALQKAFWLEDLMEEFFEITRFNLQQLVLEKQEVDLSHMLAQMADEFCPNLEAKGQRARIEAPDGLRIEADPDKLARVFQNLIKNAIAYGAQDSEILIRAAEAGSGGVRVQIFNRGRPIPKEKMDRIFEKFFRLDEARQSGRGGAGLGLAIAKEIVAAHGGGISASSGTDGTVFTVQLPRYAPEHKEILRNS